MSVCPGPFPCLSGLFLMGPPVSSPGTSGDRAVNPGSLAHTGAVPRGTGTTEELAAGRDPLRVAQPHGGHWAEQVHPRDMAEGLGKEVQREKSAWMVPLAGQGKALMSRHQNLPSLGSRSKLQALLHTIVLITPRRA